LPFARKLLPAGLAAGSFLAPVLAGLVIVPAAVQAQNVLRIQRNIDTSERIAARRAEQEAPRNMVAFDPKNFDKFVGYYQFGPNSVMTVTREGTGYLTRLTGQQNVAVYPESQTKFFATVVAACADLGWRNFK